MLGITSGAQTKGFDPWGATCLVKDEVIAFDATRARSKKWTWDELKTLCESVQARGRSLYTMLYRLGRCAVGEQYEVNGGIAVLPLPADTENVAAEVRIEVPASLGAFEDLAPALAERLGLSGALFVDITSEEQ